MSADILVAAREQVLERGIGLNEAQTREVLELPGRPKLAAQAGRPERRRALRALAG